MHDLAVIIAHYALPERPLRANGQKSSIEINFNDKWTVNHNNHHFLFLFLHFLCKQKCTLFHDHNNFGVFSSSFRYVCAIRMLFTSRAPASQIYSLFRLEKTCVECEKERAKRWSAISCVRSIVRLQAISQWLYKFRSVFLVSLSTLMQLHQTILVK